MLALKIYLLLGKLRVPENLTGNEARSLKENDQLS